MMSEIIEHSPQALEDHLLSGGTVKDYIESRGGTQVFRLISRDIEWGEAYSRGVLGRYRELSDSAWEDWQRIRHAPPLSFHHEDGRLKLITEVDPKYHDCYVSRGNSFVLLDEGECYERVLEYRKLVLDFSLRLKKMGLEVLRD